MQLWTIKSARATIGGPILESRTPCKAASFHWTTTFGDCANAGIAPARMIANARTRSLRELSRRVLGSVISSATFSPHVTLADAGSAKFRVPPSRSRNIEHGACDSTPGIAVGWTEKKRDHQACRTLESSPGFVFVVLGDNPER